MEDNKLENTMESMRIMASKEAFRKQLNDIGPEKILTNSDFAKLFQIDVRSCHRWRKTEQIPHFKISGRVYYFWSAVRAALIEKQIIK